MTIASVQQLLARRTVRITYHREADRFTVDVVEGDNVVENITRIAVSLRYDAEEAERLAEHCAARAARNHGLDITRLDVN